jgi:signal transduction histidine kinase
MSATATGSFPRRELRPPASEPWRFKLLATLTACVGGLLVVAALVAEPNGLDVIGPNFLAWMALVAIAGAFPVKLAKGIHLSMDLPLLLAAGMLYGPLPAGLLGFAACFDIRELRRLVSPWTSLFNRSQIALSAGLASAAFSLVGGRLGDWPATFGAAAVALGVDVLINVSLVATSVWARTGRPLRSTLPVMAIGAPAVHALTYGCFGLSSLLLAELVARTGSIGLVAVGVPVILGRQVFIDRRGLLEISNLLGLRAAALRRVDERIAQERRDERERIAEALHDEVLQSLYGVTLRAQVLREDLRSGHLLALDDDVPGVLAAAERAVDEMRDVIRDLRHSTVGRAGLVETVSLLASHLHQESGVLFVTSLDDEVDLDAESELLLYQIAREAMQNAVKHASCNTVWVSLRLADGWIELSVEDDGRGFDETLRRDDRHFGLQLMRERAESARGRLSIESNSGLGTAIRAWFPRS